VFRSAQCFYVVSQLNGKVLDVRGAEVTAGASLIVFDRKSVVSANQVWYEDEAGLLRCKLNGFVIDTSCESALLTSRQVLTEFSIDLGLVFPQQINLPLI